MAGVVLMVCGYCWSWFFPFNKSIWSSSYVLFTSGLGFLILASLIWVIDELKYSNMFTKIGVIFGMNAITAYVLHGILNIPLYSISIGKNESIQSFFMDSIILTGLAPEFVSLIWALLYTSLCFVPIWILFRRKVFIKI